jgi:uncharacterized membrane protein YedE/YeeE
MEEFDLSSLSHRVLWATFALSAVFGVVAQRTHFCTMGAIADVWSMGDWTRARMWVLASAVAILGFNAMAAAGWVDSSKTIYAGTQLRWLSMIVGGLLFGFGMVLASGCGSKALVRLGGGNLKSLVVLVMLAIAASATLRGISAVVRVNTVDRVVLPMAPGQDLPHLLATTTNLPYSTSAGLVGTAIALAMAAWVLSKPQGRSREVLFGGAGVGAVIVGLWWVSGRLGFLAEDPNTLQEAFLATNSRRMEALSMAAPVGYALDWLLQFSDKGKVLTMGIVSIAGVLAGSTAAAITSRSFRWESFSRPEDMVNHLLGGTLMGIGGVTALGCTIGQGLSGISTLALGSALAVASIVTGALAGLRYQDWRLERLA